MKGLAWGATFAFLCLVFCEVSGLSKLRLFQGGVPWRDMSAILAAAIASGTAVWIAYRAYPAQKEKDRELQVSQERRSAYSRFFVSAHRFYTAMYDREDDENIEKMLRQMRENYIEISFYAPPSVMMEVKSLFMASVFWEAVRRGAYDVEKNEAEMADDFGKFAEAFRDHSDTALALARAEILGNRFDEAVDDISFYEDEVRVRVE